VAYKKPDIKALTAKGLSGLEAGRIVLRETYWRGKGQKVLTDRELKAVQKSVKTLAEVITFNGLMKVAQLLEVALLRTQVTAQEAAIYLGKARTLLLIILATDGTPHKYIKQKKLEPASLEPIAHLHQAIIERLGILGAFIVVMTELEEVLGISEYLKETVGYKEDLDQELKDYNQLLSVLKGYAGEIKANVEIPTPIELKKIKLNTSILKAWKKKIAKGLTMEELTPKS